MEPLIIEPYRPDSDKKWEFRVKDENGNVICISPNQGYENYGFVEDIMTRIAHDGPHTVIDLQGNELPKPKRRFLRRRK